MIQRAFVDALKQARPRPKSEAFAKLLGEIRDLEMADVIWIYWGEQSLEILDFPMKALNPNHRWWKLFAPRNTIRSLLKTDRGREQIWRMLSDAGIWL